MNSNNIAVLGMFVFLVYLAATGRLKNLIAIVSQPKVTETAAGQTTITGIIAGGTNTAGNSTGQGIAGGTNTPGTRPPVGP